MHKFLWSLLPAVALVACAAPPREEPSPGAGAAGRRGKRRSPRRPGRPGR